MCSVNSALSSSCSAFGSPRSAKTLPLLSSTSILVFFGMLFLPLFVVTFRVRMSVADRVDFTLGRADALGRLLLKCVKHVNRVLELHGVDGAVRVPVMRRDDLQHVPPPESLQRL